MLLKPIFSDNLLSHYITDFRLSSVTDIRRITLQIKVLVEELLSGKLESLKEEEIKPRFVNTFFGDILGFNYENTGKWLLREEKKSVLDGTKPDAALGYFFNDKTNDDVRAIVEIKDAKANLDVKQNRADKQTPVEQAFDYVAKMGGRCKWVIVSNIKEIRFYPSLDRSRCQVFFLKDLSEEKKLKELLFLFHKDKFIKESDKSATDKLFDIASTLQSKDDTPLHIIDKIDNCLKRFEGFGFVNPNYLATINPFNILNDHVWHYEDQSLFTINPEIYRFLEGVTIEDEEVRFSNELQLEITAFTVIEAKQKVHRIFHLLNQCFIHEISAVKDYQEIVQRNRNTLGFSPRHKFHFNTGEGITRDIRIKINKTCDCLSCNYRSLDLNRFLSKLKIGIGNENCNTAEYAFGNYLAATNNFKTTYNIYKVIEREVKGKQAKGVRYFLAKLNIRLLHNLILDYHLEDSEEILSDIKAVNLDTVIYDEIEFDVDKEVKNYLLAVKEEALIYKLQDEIEETIGEIEKLKSLYETGGGQLTGPNLTYHLANHYTLLYLHINLNFIIYDNFKRYKSLTEKVFRGLVLSYQTPEVGLLSFNIFFLTEAILHISPRMLQKILANVNHMKIDEECLEDILQKLTNFASSYYKDGIFGDPYENSLLTEQLSNYRFKDNFTNIFTNFFTILVRLDISKAKFSKLKTVILKFLKIEKELAWFDLKEFSNFIARKGNLFEPADLLELLRISIYGDRYGYNKYTVLIEQIPKSLAKFYPDHKIDNAKLIKTAILKSTSDDGHNENYIHLVNLLEACNDNCKEILISAFENYLDVKFNNVFYEALLHTCAYDYKRKNYFQLYSEHTNLFKGGRAYKYGKDKLTDLIFFNYILIVYKLQIDFNRNELRVFTGLNDFETWILNPIEFDYNKFNARWLMDLHNTIVIERLKDNSDISRAIEVELEREFHPVLAELKYKWFN